MHKPPTTEYMLHKAKADWHAAEAAALVQLLRTYGAISSYEPAPIEAQFHPVTMAEAIVMQALQDSPDSAVFQTGKPRIAA